MITGIPVLFCNREPERVRLSDKRWGLLTSIRIPGGGELGLYQPKHPTAIGLTARE